MAQRTNSAFKVECPSCGITHESDEFEETSRFADKHTEHTNHEVEWIRADFEIDAEPFVEWSLRCDTCEESWQFSSEEQARNFQQEHAEYTDHEIDNEPTEETIELPEDGFVDDDRSLKTLISQMEGHYETGVPEQAIYAQLSGDPNLVAKAKHAIEQLRRKGEVYEPTSGQLRTT